MGLLLAVGLAAFPARAAGPDPECAPLAVTEADAVRMAAACRQSVEVLDARTPWDTLSAQPSGELTWESTALAGRTVVDGQWRPVGTAVVPGSDGLSPAAPVLPMTFSPGGADVPLARIEHDGRAVEVFWPLGALPAPSVSGPAVTYPSVLPGVDLVVTVDEDGTGFSEVLVVKTAVAADNPALSRLRFPVRTTGGLSVAEAGGGLSVVDGSGTEVFTVPTPLMWDSSGNVVGAGAPAPGQGSAARAVVPQDGDQVSAMPADVADGMIEIVPDQAMLDAAATQWPVYIDPTFDAGEGVTRNDWAMIAEAWPTTEYFEFSGSQGVGLCSVSYDSDCVRTGRKRIAFEFGFPAAIRGAVVTAAAFRAYKTHSADCSRDGYHRLYRVNSVSASTNWSNHHGHWDDGASGDQLVLDSRPPNGNCTGWEEWNALEGAQIAAANSWTTLTLGIRATDETSMPKAWRQYRNDATLSITFNRYPNTAGTPALDPSVSAGTGPSGYLVRDATPALSATVSDPDGAYGQTVKGVFEIYHSGSVLLWRGESALVASGSKVSPQTSPPTLSEGVLYTVRVWAVDAAGLKSKAWSNYIQFKVDVTPPAAAPAVQPHEVGTGIAAKYVENAWAGGPGQTGKFALSANGVSDANRFRYSFDSTSYTGEVAAGSDGASTSPVSYAPTAPGLHTLRVWTVDAAGWVGPVRTYPFWVNVAPKAAWWLLDGNGADSAAGAANPVTVTGTAGWIEGPLVGEYPTDRALRFDGTSTGAATTGPVVHTGGSFTITALVNVNELGTSRIAVSQDGVNISGFKLGVLNDSSLCPAQVGSPCWAFWAANQDSASSTHTRTVPDAILANPSRFVVQPGTWTALAAVYDAATHELRLYVNGELAGVTTYTATWDATGSLRIGQAMSGGAAQYRWSGDLDDVRAYRTALDPDTIRRVAVGSRAAADIPQ